MQSHSGAIRRACASLLVFLPCVLSIRADDHDKLTVGEHPDGRIVVPTNQILEPAGLQAVFPGRPVDLALAEGGKVLVVKNRVDLTFIGLPEGRFNQTLDAPLRNKQKVGFSVVGLAVIGDRVLVTDAEDHLSIALRQSDGQYTWERHIQLNPSRIREVTEKGKKSAHPAGIAVLSDTEVFVTTTRCNSVQRVNLTSGKVEEEIPVGVAPYMVLMLGSDRAYVTNWGGDPPRPGDPQDTSSGTPIRIDPKTGVASHGSVSVLKKEAGRWKQTKTISVGLHPSGMCASKGKNFVYVANANSDSVSVLDTSKDEVIEYIKCRPEARLPFGSGTNAVTLSPGGETLYVANGTNNCVAVVRLAEKSSEVVGRIGNPSTGKGPIANPSHSTIDGLIPTGWYPGAVLVSADGKTLHVANIKGHGSLGTPKTRAREKRKNTHDHQGTVSIIDVPDAATLKQYTERVNRNNRLGYSLSGLEKPRKDVKAVPVPQRHGELSMFEHVIYIIKENRTYDQVFGDMKEGRGDANLVLFGEEVTPNHHALARQFTLFDNFYCSGVLSADGHTWCNEAYVSDYLEKAFGGFTRSYPDDGSDPLAYVPTGHLWSNALAQKKSLRVYGEYIKNEYLPKDVTWTDFYNDYKNGSKVGKVLVRSNIEALNPYTCLDYPWFPLLMPDVYRARIFLNELKDFEKTGKLPNLVYLALPCDHTDGTRPGYPTPRAMVADNDLALGQIVEAISHSKFWPKTCIFVVEDDPQNGFDHIDPHRTVALVISPYTKRKYVDSTCYNQTGMVKTIEMLLGLPPMNQLDLSATPMRYAFQEKADLTPYRAVPNRIRLDEMNPDVKKLAGKALHWAKKSLELNLDEGDEADEDALNRILWHAVRGYETPYPEKFAGGKDE